MKKLILSVFLILLFGIKAYAIDEIMIEHNMAIQKHIDSIGFNILNRNKIDKNLTVFFEKIIEKMILNTQFNIIQKSKITT